MGTFADGESGSSVRTKINTAIEKTEGTTAIGTINVDGGAIDGVTLGTNSAVTEAQVDNININGNTISSTNTNGDVTIDPNGTGDVNVGNFKFDADQTVGAGQDNYVLTYDNSGGKISLEAASGGSLSGNMAGDIASNGHEIKFADSGAADADKLTFGASDDLEIYHDGSNSYIKESGTGDLRLQAANLAVQNTFGQYMIEANNGGGVNLYHNTTLKVATLSDGAAVRGQLKIQNSGGTTQYTLPTADGSANQVLQTDGSGAVTFADAGGSGAALYDANESSPAAQPSATGANAIAIGDSAVSNNTQNVAIGHSADAITGTYNTALGPYATANGSFYAVAIGSDSGGNPATAGGSGSFATVGGVTAGNRAHALGNAYASGVDSFAAVITNRTSNYGATSVYSVAIGYQNKASGPWSFAAGGLNNIASQSASIAMGNGNTASGERSFSLGASNTASGYSSFAHGSNSKAAHRGKKAFASGQFSAVGDAQGGQFILRVSTTDATPTVLSTDNGSSLSTAQIIAASDTCITFDGTITAMQNGAQSYASWRIEGLLVNDGGTTTLANSAITVIQNSSSWGMALSADNTNNALSITGTGEASHNIRWVANIRTTEVTYA